MTVSSTTVTLVYERSDVSSPYTTFSISTIDYDTDDESVIKVYIRDESTTPTDGVYTETLQVDPTNYSISGTSVVLTSALGSNEKLIIRREVTDNQEFDPLTTALLDADALEAELDEMTRMIQENSEALTRALLFLPGAEKTGFNLPQPTANQFLKWNSAADGLENSGAITDQDLFTTDSVTFAGVTVTGLTASRPVVTNGSSALATGKIDLSSTNYVDNTLPIGNGGTGQTTQTAAFDALAPTTTKGDIIAFNGSDNVRLPAGNNGEVLQADSSESTGLKWATSASGTLSTKGDLFTYDTANARLPVGTNGQVLTANSSESTGLEWVAATALGADPLTTKGDIFTYDTDAQRLAVGTNGQFLTANSATATGLEWATLSVDLTADVGATILPQANGGTGIDTSSVTNGQILIGNTTGNALALATITGTSNQVSVSNGASSITLSTPQDIGTASNVTFNQLTLDAALVLGDTGGGSETITIQAPTDANLAASYTLTLPQNDGDANQVLTTDGSGVLSWAAAGSGGGFIDPGAEQTANYAADADDDGRIVLVDTSGGSYTVTLPTPSAGLMIGVKDATGDSNANPITIARNGSEEIDSGAADDIINTPFECKQYISDGTNWYRIAKFTGSSTAGRAVIGGGFVSAAATNVIQYVSIPTTGNATDFGDLTTARYYIAGLSSSTRGVYGGGNTGSQSNVMDYITIASTGNATDFGDLVATKEHCAPASNDTRGLWMGGFNYNVIEYITIATTGNTTDFGDLLDNYTQAAGNCSTTRALSGGGYVGLSSEVNVIQYVTIASTGNATDFGDLTLARRGLTACSSSTRGIFAGRAAGTSRSNIIDYVTIASTGNATDFGDLLAAQGDFAGTSNKQRGIFAGGDSGPSNVIQYITIASTGNATDFGDLLAANSERPDGLSDAHGGLS